MLLERTQTDFVLIDLTAKLIFVRQVGAWQVQECDQMTTLLNHIAQMTCPVYPDLFACRLSPPETVQGFGRRECNEGQEEIWQDQPKA